MESKILKELRLFDVVWFVRKQVWQTIKLSGVKMKNILTVTFISIFLYSCASTKLNFIHPSYKESPPKKIGVLGILPINNKHLTQTNLQTAGYFTFINKHELKDCPLSDIQIDISKLNKLLNAQSNKNVYSVLSESKSIYNFIDLNSKDLNLDDTLTTFFSDAFDSSQSQIYIEVKENKRKAFNERINYFLKEMDLDAILIGTFNYDLQRLEQSALLGLLGSDFYTLFLYSNFQLFGKNGEELWRNVLTYNSYQYRIADLGGKNFDTWWEGYNSALLIGELASLDAIKDFPLLSNRSSASYFKMNPHLNKGNTLTTPIIAYTKERIIIGIEGKQKVSIKGADLTDENIVYYQSKDVSDEFEWDFKTIDNEQLRDGNYILLLEPSGIEYQINVDRTNLIDYRKLKEDKVVTSKQQSKEVVELQNSD